MVSLLFLLLGLYLLFGVGTTLLLLRRGVGQLDPAAQHTGLVFKLLVFPGLTVFWPLWVWRKANHLPLPPVERNAHRDNAEKALKRRLL